MYWSWNRNAWYADIEVVTEMPVKTATEVVTEMYIKACTEIVTEILIKPGTDVVTGMHIEVRIWSWNRFILSLVFKVLTEMHIEAGTEVG